MTLTEFKKLNKDSGRCWFDTETMRHFSTEIEFWDAAGGFFVTSEKFNRMDPKTYTVRMADFNSGRVQTVGEFRQENSLQDAVNRIIEFKKDGK